MKSAKDLKQNGFKFVAFHLYICLCGIGRVGMTISLNVGVLTIPVLKILHERNPFNSLAQPKL
jgi:hypothetical protein